MLSKSLAVSLPLLPLLEPFSLVLSLLEDEVKVHRFCMGQTFFNSWYLVLLLERKSTGKLV